MALKAEIRRVPSPSLKWDRWFLDLAHRVGAWSKDPSTQVGAIIVRDDRTIASLGFNGLPRGVVDSSDRYDDRATKYLMTVHAEANAIASARSSIEDCTVYVSPLHPCAQCAALLIQAGIKRVVAKENHRPDWQDQFMVAATMFAEAGVRVTILCDDV
jgi:dCMP deaminase